MFAFNYAQFRDAESLKMTITCKLCRFLVYVENSKKF